ncbi:MAG: helix-turn-helix domain-containing protein [Eubacteriales bacterium]
MISNQLLQSTINGFKEIARVDFTIYDVMGNYIVATLDEPLDLEYTIIQFAQSQADDQEVQGTYLYKIMDHELIEYILTVSGSDEQAYTIGKMAAFQLSSLVDAYKEKFDREDFIKDLLLDNLLKIDIYSRAQKLDMVIEARRVAMIVEVQRAEGNGLIEELRKLDCLSGDSVTAVEESNIVIVKSVSSEETEHNLSAFSSQLCDIIEENGHAEVRISYGTIAEDLREVSGSYKEAKMALDVGRIFLADLHIIPYSELGIGRLIYQLPLPLCKMFIQEIFDDTSLDDFDEETHKTINKFFENSLNVSETSRQLFIHRNTLVYRLDKLQKSTNLDLRVFDDAITFKIAMMVVKYMKYMETY